MTLPSMTLLNFRLGQVQEFRPERQADARFSPVQSFWISRVAQNPLFGPIYHGYYMSALEVYKLRQIAHMDILAPCCGGFKTKIHNLQSKVLVEFSSFSTFPMSIAVMKVNTNRIQTQPRNQALPIAGTTTFCSSGIAKMALWSG